MIDQLSACALDPLSAIPFCRASLLNSRLILHPDSDYHRALTDRVSERKSSMIPGRTNIENRQGSRSQANSSKS